MKIRTRKRGKTFSYVFEAGKVDGKRKVIEKGGFATRQDAYDAGVIAFNDFIHGNFGVTSKKISFADFVSKWLNNVAALNLKPTSLQTYTYFFKKYILPSLGNKSVQELTPADIDTFIRKLAAEGFSRHTLTSIRTRLCQVFDYAVFPANIIGFNPAKFIKVPKKAPKNIVKRHIITLDKFAELVVENPALYIPLLLLYFTGMRVSEVCGLCWRDVDFGKKVISVNRQIVYVVGKGLYFTTPKTESSVREIFIDDFLVAELKSWKARQSDKTFYIYNDGGRVIQADIKLPLPVEEVICTRDDGRLIRNFTIEKFLQSHGLNVHSFRHTHATLLIEHGATPKGVAERLGHSSVNLMQNLYVHNTQKLQRETADIFSRFLQNGDNFNPSADN